MTLFVIKNLLIILLFQIFHRKENSHEQHEVSVIHQAQAIRALLNQSMELFSSLRVWFRLQVWFVDVEIETITAPKILRLYQVKYE